MHIKKAAIENDTINSILGYYFLSDILKNDNIYLNYMDSLVFETKKRPNKMFPAYLYKNKGKFYLDNGRNNESLKNYLLAIKYSDLYKNDSLKYIVKQRVGILKSKNGKSIDALKLYLECYNYYSNNTQKIDNYNHHSLFVNIAITYSKLKKYDSASFFNKKGFNLSINMKNSNTKGYSIYGQGIIEYKQKNYKTAIDSIEKSLYWINNDKNYSTLSRAYSIISKSYQKLNNPKKTFQYNLKIDSLYQKTNITHYSQKSSYAFLSNYYKEKNDIKNQLIYLEKLLKVDSILNTRDEKLAKTFTKEYDIPKLKAEKEAIISQLKEKTQKITYGFIAFSSIIILLLGYQIRKRKILKKRFEALLNTNKTEINNTIKPKEKQEISVPKEIIESVLCGLEKFEKNKGFTKTNLTLNDFADKLKTNTNYLSKIINHYKNKNLSSYLRDLRIAYALDILEKDERIRKYTIKAIANEVGFNTAESFANAFHKKTGLKPSYYIKELNKRKAA